MGTEIPYLGSKISLISKAEIRYEGVLYSIDAKESTVALAKVRSFGTEDRPTEHPVQPRDEIFEYIIFRGTDIKDLHVCDSAKIPLANQAPHDPAIVQSSLSSGNLAPSYPYPNLGGPYPQQQQQQQQQNQQQQQQQNQQQQGPGHYSGYGHLNFSGQHQFSSALSTHSTVGSRGTTPPPNYRQRKSSSCGSRSPSPYVGSHQPSEQQSTSDDRSIIIRRGNFTNSTGTYRGGFRGTGDRAGVGSQIIYQQIRRDGPTRSDQYQALGGNGGGGSSNNRYNNRDKDNQQHHFQQQRLYPNHYQPNLNHRPGPDGMHYYDYRQFRGRAPSRGYFNPFNGRRGMPRGGGPPRGYIRAGFAIPPRIRVLKFDSEFDFESANAQFDKEQIEKELKEKLRIESKDHVTNEATNSAEVNGDEGQEGLIIAQQTTFYDKNKSFFDSISCEALDKNSNRPNWREEKKLNIETFGPRSATNFGRRFRARSRGYGRGGGGYSMDNGYHFRGGYRSWANQYRGGGRVYRGWSKQQPDPVAVESS